MMKRLLSFLLACALMLSACAVALADDVMRPGDEGDNVKELQQLLANYGYYTGAIDGKYGPGTKNAVINFQNYNHLIKDGKAGPDTMARLKGSDVVSAPVKSDDAKVEDIKHVQTRLAFYGYYTGAVDGKFGKTTIAAIKAFQAANGLKVDGAAGPLTMEKLNSATAVAKKDANLEPTSDEIKHIQSRLIHYGFYTGLIDGVFGNGTLAAVKDFQSANGLEVDGKVGEKTLAKLNSSTAVSKKDVEAERDSWLQKGDKGAAIITLQQHLKNTLYYSGDIDGIFDDDVHNAVVQFQKSAGIQADGIVGASTRTALYNRTAAIFNGGTPVRTLEIGCQGYDVKVLQQRLFALNYYNAPVTGVYNNATVEAVKAFQKANGMNQDGQADAIVRRHLWPSAAENTPSKYPILSKGATGEYVTQAQLRLKAAGFLKDTADGVYGPMTVAAVKAFQKSRSLTVDGKIGANTWAALMGVDLNGANPKPTAPLNLVLRPGATGANVTTLQQNLVALGYNIKVDGVYGPATTAAVKSFQTLNSLTVDGKAGPNTLRKINELLSK